MKVSCFIPNAEKTEDGMPCKYIKYCKFGHETPYISVNLADKGMEQMNSFKH